MSFEEFVLTFPTSTVEYQLLRSVENFVGSQLFVVLVAFLKTVSFVISGFLLVLIVYFYIKTNVFGEKIKSIKAVVSSKPTGLKKKLAAEFHDVKVKLGNNKNEDDRQAVVKADSCLIEALSAIGFKGKGFKEIVSEKSLWSSVSAEKIIKAHEIRNQAVHFSESLTHAEAEEAIASYEKALKDLGCL